MSVGAFVGLISQSEMRMDIVVELLSAESHSIALDIVMHNIMQIGTVAEECSGALCAFEELRVSVRLAP